MKKFLKSIHCSSTQGTQKIPKMALNTYQPVGMFISCQTLVENKPGSGFLELH